MRKLACAAGVIELDDAPAVGNADLDSLKPRVLLDVREDDALAFAELEKKLAAFLGDRDGVEGSDALLP